ncbi:hypothetical protein SVIOM74S_05726 [Streptomyces violarus]
MSNTAADRHVHLVAADGFGDGLEVVFEPRSREEWRVGWAGLESPRSAHRIVSV